MIPDDVAEEGISNRVYVVEYHPRLVENVVLLAMRGHRKEESYREERDGLYEIRDPEESDSAFLEFNRKWFTRMELQQPVQQALDERPVIAAATGRCFVAAARSKVDEGAELFVTPESEGQNETAGRVVGMKIRPESFLDPEGLVALLRHEVLHIACIVDPSFGYQPSLVGEGDSRILTSLLQARYRALWDAVIDGQLLLEGKSRATARPHRLRDFSRVFPMLGDRTEEAFARLFDIPSHTHPELVAYARTPEKMLPESHGERRRKSDCPLCGFPTYALRAEVESLTQEVVARITEDFPTWRPEHGSCEQCADLYRSRSVARAQDA